MKPNLVLIVIIVFGFPAVFGLSRFLEANQTPIPAEIAETDLAFKAETFKRYSFGFEGLIADYYWASALQYIGQKIVQADGLQNIQIDNLKPLNPHRLYPLLDATTTIDPDFTAAYSYGAIVLPAIDTEQAIKFIEKGIAAQPDNWQLYQHLGFIYWKNKNFKKAAEVYAVGAAKPGAPPFMKQMSAKMEVEGGSRETAREIYQQLYENAPDAQTKDLAFRRLLEIQSLYERDLIRQTLQEFQNKNNRCAANWREVFPILRTAKSENVKNLRFTASDFAPMDPSEAPYLLDNENGKCEAQIDRVISKVPPTSLK